MDMLPFVYALYEEKSAWPGLFTEWIEKIISSWEGGRSGETGLVFAFFNIDETR